MTDNALTPFGLSYLIRNRFGEKGNAGLGRRKFQNLGRIGRAISAQGGGTQHIHIRGGKSDIFGSEYCEK